MNDASSIRLEGGGRVVNGLVTGGAAVVDGLAAHGVTAAFGIPGTHNLEIYRHLPGSGIRHVVTRHEQGAGYAADGFARVSGRPGVVITTSGPGIANAVTALATAYADSVPVLAISPGPARGTVGRDVGWLHEMKDQQAVLDAACARSVRVESAEEIPETIAEIFAGFASTRSRPVHLEVPLDVLEGEWARRPVEVLPTPGRARPDAGLLDAAADALICAQRPLIVAGGGARQAGEQIRALADLGIPVLTTVNGKGVLDEEHPACLGAGMRLRAAHELIDRADLLLVVGSELGDSDLWGGFVREGGEGRTVVRIDLDPAQLHKNVRADIPLLGDAGLALDGLADRLAEAGAAVREVDPGWRAALVAEASLDDGPWKAIQGVLSRAMPADTVVAGDSSQVTYYGTVHSWPFSPDNRLLYPTGYATLGYGLPAAIGAKIADPARPVLALVGDGAAMFSIQELMTATELGLGIPVIVADNGGYAEIRQQMLDRGIAPLGVDLACPDFAALARAFGAHGVEAETVDDLGPIAVRALGARAPTLIHHDVT